MARSSTDFENALKDYRLTTAELIYHLPDHPVLLQTYVWQEFDLPPEFPKLHEFINFWTKSIEGQLHSIRVMYANALVPNDLVNAVFSGYLH